MKPACAFGDSSRSHLMDKKGRHEGNDIYVLGKPSCSKLPQRGERGRGRCLPLLQAGEHLLGRQPGSRAGSIPVPRATPTSICCKMEIPAWYAHRNGEGKPVSGREGALRFAPGVLLGVAQGNLVTLSWGEAGPGACRKLQTLAGCLHTRCITKLSLGFLI